VRDDLKKNDLHPDVTEQLLHAIFSPVGPICSVQVCRSTITNQSHGYGFVTFEHRQHAENALENAVSNFGEILKRREVCVRNGKPKKKESSSNPPVSLIVNELHPNVTAQELHAIFFPFGPMCTVKVYRDKRTNLSHGYGFVTFECRHDAEKAPKALKFSELMGKPMNIMWGEDTTIKVLARDDERGFSYIYFLFCFHCV
uniref:RRM domain-containing protein n=1 Tax=Sinocyclocheilus anshuiensis TaxID=1608454 RepID=A0A671KG52_9TELE